MAKTKKTKKILFVIRDPVLQSAVTFYIGHNWLEFNKIFNKIKHESEKPLDPNHESSNGLAVGAKNLRNEMCHIVWMRFFTWKIKYIGVLSHELIHAVGHIMQDKQIPIRLENDEIFAYLHEFYQNEALKKLNSK